MPRVCAALIATFVLFTCCLGAHADEPAPGPERSTEQALAGLDVAPGLEATLFAAEPMILNPTNIDVDHRGRVWLCEVVNYRHRDGSRPEGDRILILEDTNADGRADKTTVFYQGRDVDTAMGICVLGNKVIVSVSPNVFVFTDTDGDDKADKKELLFSKTGQAQHDHSAHAFTFGPDGKLYWNFGNTGEAVHDKNGKPVFDRSGNKVVDNGAPYRGGMVFRCNLDGSEFEVLANNFRNNYEVAVDSFGTLWQSDNDDDGNFGVRINYVMEFGNYGYREEFTGAGWQERRVNMEAEVPLQHWHLNDPGVVPNLLQTGAGSPTGIAIYEGDLLPEVFRNQMIHCDAGPNIVRSYPVKVSGAGYTAESVNVLHGARDQWFRPADVCVAPDGSLIVADWYDPGVGGHRMGDIERGRIFRIAPPNSPYKIPKFDFETPEGAVEALKNPNLATRYLAWTALNAMQQQAKPALQKMFDDRENPRHRARALWLLGKIKGQIGMNSIGLALGDRDPNIRITGLRIARQLMRDPAAVVTPMTYDASPQVRREYAIALRHSKSPQMPGVWAELALQYDGNDRWYLEALGIAADGQWDRCFEAWLAKAGKDWSKSKAGRDIAWRSRASRTPLALEQLLTRQTTPADEVPRYLRAFDFHHVPGSRRQQVLAKLAFDRLDVDEARANLIAAEAVSRLEKADLDRNPEYRAALKRILDTSRGTAQFVKLVNQFDVQDRYPELLALAQAHPQDQIAVDCMQTLLAKKQVDGIIESLNHSDEAVVTNTLLALGTAADGRAMPILQQIVGDEGRQLEIRREAVQSLARTRGGAQSLIKMTKQNTLDARLKDAAALALHSAQWRDIKEQVAELFPLPPAKDDKPLPPVGDLVQAKGDVDRGRIAFNVNGTCAKCHVVNDIGKEVGPNLSEIGGKLSREALYHSILFPSAGISHNYETHTFVLDSGTVATGIIVSETPELITIKGSDALVREITKDEIVERKKEDVSLMPADLPKAISMEELVDIVEYLTTLRAREGEGEAAAPPASGP